MTPTHFTKNIATIVTKLLRKFPPEIAHNLAGYALKKNLLPFRITSTPLFKGLDLTSKLSDKITLTHPLGLAAGFDKNAQFLSGLSRLGFSFIEVGAATPLPQEGNPSPRIFRYPDKKALINRMGFNNVGIEKINNHLIDFFREEHDQPVGINIGVNKTTPLEKALDDYLIVLKTTTKKISYYSINLSSPNTESLKFLCHPQVVKSLADRIKTETAVPLSKVWIKLGPNLEKPFFQSLVKSVFDCNFAGLVLTNTLPVKEPELGGLSGLPLLEKSKQALEWAWEVHEGLLPMIAVGGISNGKDLYERIRRGATLAQIYTAFIYEGPFVVESILKEFSEILKSKNISNLDELRGSYYS